MLKLSDNQIGDRLHTALEVLGTDEGETIRGNTALVAARRHSPSRARSADRGGAQFGLPQHGDEPADCPAIRVRRLIYFGWTH